MKLWFVISMILVVSLAEQFASAGPCREARELRREQIKYDISMRKQRIKVKQSIIDLKIRDNEFEKKLVEIHEKMLNSQGEEISVLWKQYDAVSAERDALLIKMDSANETYTLLSHERARGKMDMKYKQLKKRYECIFNSELDAKLDAIVKNSSVMEKLPGGDGMEFKALVKQREDALKTLQRDYNKYSLEIEAAIKQYESANNRAVEYAKGEDTAFGEREKIREHVDELLSNFNNEVNRTSEKLDDISSKMFESPMLKNK